MAAVSEALRSLRRVGRIPRPFSRTGIGVALRFLAGGGRSLTLRVPASAALPDGLRTLPVRLLLQPDGDVLLTLPREALDAGLIDGRSVERLGARLKALSERTRRRNPFWGLDALQAGLELVTAAWVLLSTPGLMRSIAAGLTGVSVWTLPVWTAPAWDAAMALAPTAAAAVFATARPWLTRRLAGVAMRRIGA